MPQNKLTKRNIDVLRPAAVRYTMWDTDVSGFEIALPREASWFTSSNTASVASNAGTRSAAMGRLGHPKWPERKRSASLAR